MGMKILQWEGDKETRITSGHPRNEQIRAIDEEHDSRTIGNLQSNQPARLSTSHIAHGGPATDPPTNLVMTAMTAMTAKRCRPLGDFFSPPQRLNPLP